MKQSFLVIISIFLSLFINAQMAKADVSITSLVVQPPPPKVQTLVPPTNTTNQSVAQSNSNVVRDSTIFKARIDKTPPPPQFGSYKCIVTVQNGNEDDAHETMLIVSVPTWSPVSLNSSNATAQRFVYNTSYPGYIQFNLGTMKPGQSVTVNFHFHTTGFSSRNLSAYVISKSSDPNGMNNYKDANF